MAQATGVPATVGCYGSYDAWAPAEDATGDEWLEVFFEVPVKATGLDVYETYGAGFIYKVDLIDTDGNYYNIWEGTDTTACTEETTDSYGWFTLNFPETDYEVAGAIIHTQKDGYEEIDAVGIKAAAANDVVTITKAEYKADKDEFKVEATSSDQPSVTLTVVGYGTMTWKAKKNKYEYKAKPVADPGATVTVTSSGGGQDTTAVKH